MNLKDAYIIDGDVIEKRIAELESALKNPFRNTYYNEAKLNLLKELKEQHLKPALPIVEETWDDAYMVGFESH